MGDINHKRLRLIQSARREYEFAWIRNSLLSMSAKVFATKLRQSLLNALCRAVHRDIAAKNAKFLTMLNWIAITERDGDREPRDCQWTKHVHPFIAISWHHIGGAINILEVKKKMPMRASSDRRMHKSIVETLWKFGKRLTLSGNAWKKKKKKKRRGQTVVARRPFFSFPLIATCYVISI